MKFMGGATSSFTSVPHSEYVLCDMLVLLLPFHILAVPSDTQNGEVPNARVSVCFVGV